MQLIVKLQNVHLVRGGVLVILGSIPTSADPMVVLFFFHFLT